MAKNRYIQVILPLKLEWEPFYSLPEGMEVEVGSRVRVIFARAFYVGCVSRVDVVPEVDPKRILSIEAVEKDMPLVQESEIAFWRELARYYLCTVGEVYKVAYPRAYKGKSTVKLPETALPPVQSQDGELADALRSASKTVLLRGQGSRPVLSQQARETLEEGRSVLVLVPEMVKADAVPGALVFSSALTPGKRKALAEKVRSGEPCLIIGTRSALFLPFQNLGLIIVEQEHDPAYKQDAPAPRYHARESAIMLAGIHKAKVILASPTPSLESLYNARCGRYLELQCNQPQEAKTIEVINPSCEYRKNGMAGAFSLKLLSHMRATLDSGQQVLLVAPRRVYEEGRKVEDNVLEYFPEARVANLDQGQPDDEYDIYIASTATTRGFRCRNLGLVGLVSWDGMLSRQDFRADERALQLLRQFLSLSPVLVIQTREPRHPVFKHISRPEELLESMLQERSLVGYPPFTRMIKLVVKDEYSESRLHYMAQELAAAMGALGVRVEGPMKPFQDEPLEEIRLLLPRDKTLLTKKAAISKTVAAFEANRKYSGHIAVDVDPL